MLLQIFAKGKTAELWCFNGILVVLTPFSQRSCMRAKVLATSFGNDAWLWGVCLQGACHSTSSAYILGKWVFFSLKNVATFAVLTKLIKSKGTTKTKIYFTFH
jgi:hypothetical protein